MGGLAEREGLLLEMVGVESVWVLKSIFSKM